MLPVGLRQILQKIMIYILKFLKYAQFLIFVYLYMMFNGLFTNDMSTNDINFFSLTANRLC